MTRLEALEQAREFVQEIYAVKNYRGYPRFSGSAPELLAEIRTVAQFIIDGDDDDS